jgi:hypothetical protein
LLQAALDGVIEDGVVDVLLEYAIQHAHPNNSNSNSNLPGPSARSSSLTPSQIDATRCAAFSLLSQIWQLLPAQMALRADSARIVMELLRSGCRSESRTVQVACLTEMFSMLDR